MPLLRLARAQVEVRLTKQLGRGGEGKVFAIDQSDEVAAKIYNCPPEPLKVRKLRAMAEMAGPDLLRVSAWPDDLLIDAKGVVVGFTMPRISARRDIHELYSPKSRGEAFPAADFKFLAHVGANISRVFAVVHSFGHVLGDVNHGNILIGPGGTAAVIDCDSFQIASNGEIFTSDVGASLFTPPELHGRTFRGLVRTPNHDLFGLAILVFQLLYMGRHPFAGRFAGRGEMPIERAIAEYRFAYGPDRRTLGMERPPGTIALETMGSEAAACFIRAFGRLGVATGRPDARTWVRVLEQLKSGLQGCKAASWHQLPAGATTCPWCDLERTTGVRLFGQGPTLIGPTGMVDVEALWKAISVVPDPGADPEVPPRAALEGLPQRSSLSMSLRGLRTFLSVGLGLAGFVACNALPERRGLLLGIVLLWVAIAFWSKYESSQLAARESAFVAARSEWQTILAKWQREARRARFTEGVRKLESARDKLRDIGKERSRRLAVLERKREARQRQRYLDRFRIDRATIRGIGAGRKAMLASYGIETAADIDARSVMQIPGFGSALATALMLWRLSHEAKFRFNPNEPVAAADLSDLERDLGVLRRGLVEELRKGPEDLRRLSFEIAAARQRLRPIAERAWRDFNEAEARRSGR